MSTDNSQLLVEGNNDKHVVMAICVKHNVSHSFEISDFNSNTELIRQISSRVKQEAVSRIGIMLDADQNPGKVWHKLSAELSALGYTMPDILPVEGFIHDKLEIFPMIGVWLMPDNNSAGMLEDFVRNLIPETDDLKEYTDNVLTELERVGLNRYNAELHRTKAFIHTYLAWQKKPGIPMGQSITMHYLDYNVELCTRFVGWLNALFNSNSPQ